MKFLALTLDFSRGMVLTKEVNDDIGITGTIEFEGISTEIAELEAIIDESGGSNEITATSGPDSNRRKSIMERSVVWDHFEKIYGPNEEPTVKCKYCAFPYPNFKIKNGTLGLNGHMGRCSKFPHNVETNQRLLGFQKIQGGKKSSEGMLVPWKFDQELCRAALARMIIVDELPFRFG
ncbi:uncharacterized protein LOC132061189 [Lycium ferocissimum]|uniref:uncharacterized protein LOC132061189 n=1 Tax=Lycium ferocissimum TaxID=112874 RepID=UPI002815DE51|nr:uncharacterized protein LOC132061189 [Lycium ferocissimum]